jgi:rod shape determining protein RodA
MLGRSTSYTARGLTTPRPGVFSGRRPRSLLARAFARNSPLRHMDWLLIVVVLGLSAIGTLLVWSATQPGLLAAGQDPRTYLKKQLLNVMIGLVLMIVVSLVDTRQLRTWVPFFYGATLLALLAVLTPAGTVVNGARAWFSLPVGFQIEPNEFAKVALILMTAMIFSQARPGTHGGPGVRSLLIALACAAPLIGLVVIEPALGVALVLVVVTATMIVLSGLRLRVIAALAGLVAVIIAAAGGLHLLKSYQLTRFTSFLHPAADLAGAGYNAAQAKIAVGSGGMFGQGLFHGRLVAGNFVPSQQTDFIFTVAGEELRRRHRDRLPARRGDRPGAAHRHPRGRPVRPAGRVGHRDVVRVPVVREHRHDDRHHADHRPSAAFRLLRRLRRLRRHDRDRPASVGPPSSHRVRVAASCE